MSPKQINFLETIKLPICYCKVSYELYGTKVWLLDLVAVNKVLKDMGYGPQHDECWHGQELLESRLESLLAS